MSGQQVLEIDAGNTALKWRLLAEGGVAQAQGGFVYQQWPEAIWPDSNVERVRVACVADDAIKKRINDWVAGQWQLQPEFAATQASYGGLTVAYRDERRLGVDRWLAMLAAREDAGGQGVCVVDCGSALTLDVVDAQGVHQGGYIVPGLAMMEQALLRDTGQIKLVEQLEATDRPGELGKSTEQAVVWGALRMAGALVNEVCSQLDPDQYRLYATGGGMAQLQAWLSTPQAVTNQPDLVLDGLALALP